MKGYLYALEIPGMGVRVGKSRDAAVRLMDHRTLLRSYGLDGDGRQFIVGPMSYYGLAELEVHRRLKDHRVGRGRELFKVPFKVAVEAVVEMEEWTPPMNRRDRSNIRRREIRVRRDLHARLAVAAARRGVSGSDLADQAVEWFLDLCCDDVSS